MPGKIDWQLVMNYGSDAILALIVLVIGVLSSRWAQRAVVRICTKAKLDNTLARFFSKMARWAALGLTAMFVLDTFGIDVSSFAVVLGAMGLAVGMALQGTLGHFASGVMLLIFRPFKVGDTINVAGVSGVVFEIDLFSTAIDTFDNRRLIVPNSNVFGKTIENLSHHQTRRIQVDVGTSYDADIETTRAVLEKVVAANEYRLADKNGDVILVALGDSAVNWTIRIWCNRSDVGACKQQLISQAKSALEGAGIELPFPQLQIHKSE
ncbi:MAG: mechanosensitive ion channel [Planctomycetota bacterium]|jgi:small conductance mechanosensitive channel|nr:mechanosensitive ion channel [Planctomycetota bacterium]